MTWSDITPFPSSGGKPTPGAVMLSATRPDGRFRHALWILVRPALWVGGCPAWLKLDSHVSVQVGSAANAGQLRLAPGGPFRIGQMTRHADVLRITLPALPLQHRTKQKGGACEFDWQDDWVEITLPDWCRPRPAVPQPAVSPAAGRASVGRAA